MASVASLDETRLPVAWALAEATARTSEMSAVTGAHADLDAGRVWLQGGSFVEPRWGFLSTWGRGWVERRIEVLGDESRALTYDGNGSERSQQAAACMSISSTLARAGIADELGVRPLSVTAWAGRRILEETGRVELVAHRLGLRSLDRTARLVGFDWRATAEHGDR